MGSLDYVLKRVAHAMEREMQQDGVPEARLMRLETQQVLMDIIACLKPKERQIFESHFSTSVRLRKSPASSA